MLPMIIDVLGTHIYSATEPSLAPRVAPAAIQRNANLSSVRATITVPFNSHMRYASCDSKINDSKNDFRLSVRAILTMTTERTM